MQIDAGFYLRGVVRGSSWSLMAINLSGLNGHDRPLDENIQCGRARMQDFAGLLKWNNTTCYHGG